MARRIVITSGKGGVGKTTLTAQLGISLAKMGLRVVLVDLDIGLNNLDVALSLENKVVFDLIDVIENKCRVKQALVQHHTYQSLYILPSVHNSKMEISGQNIVLIINKLNDMFDYILIDSPAGIEFGFHRAVATCSEAIIVTTPHLSSIRDADKVVSLLAEYELLSVNIVVNRVRGDMVLSGEMMDAYEVFSLLSATPLGIIPEDDYTNIGTFNSTSKVTNAFDILANNLHNGKNQMYNYTKKYSGLFGALRRSINRR